MKANPFPLTAQQALRLDFAEAAGWQEGIPEVGLPGFSIWTLRKPIPGHPAGSTVSEQTLDAGIAAVHPITPTPAQKLAEFAELRRVVESPDRPAA